MLLAVVKAFRLRTLPLAVSGICMAAAIAYIHDSVNYRSELLLPAVLTAILLQILSNLANDYGDYLKGTDQKAGRVDRMTQQLKPKLMKTLVLAFGVGAFGCGIYLLWLAFGLNNALFWFMLGIGLAALAAAVMYTMGKRPYGYRALGDLFVFIFFGVIAVCGAYLLFTGKLTFAPVLPAASIGCLSVGVLTLNNYRDIETDKMAGKITVPVKLGRKKTRVYFYLLTLTAFLLMLGYQNLTLDAPMEKQINLLFFFPHFMVCSKMSRSTKAESMNVFLKIYALATALFVVAFIVNYILF